MQDSRKQIDGLPVVRRNVAGIDLGSERHWVCAPTVDGTAREVADFGATTPELIRMGEWLKERGVESVAMESTGVYWIAPHEVLEAAGLKVLLVDTRQMARVPGRDKKSDPSDCEWIQRLHSCGLLRGSFRPEEAVCMLRTLVRDKANLVSERGDWVRRMQKSLDQMNVRVHRAVSDVDGVTGMAILRAIVAGERDGRVLAQLRDARCHKSEEEIAEQLSGHWREDHLFSLRQALKMYDAIQERMAEYEREILRQLAEKLAAAQRARKRRQATNIYARIANARLAKSVLDVGWSSFRSMLRYKATAHGAWYEEVNESLSSRVCSSCHAKTGPKGIAELGIRSWVCAECGVSHDRDINSARNILFRSGLSNAC